MSNGPAILFYFHTLQDAYNAFETLQELGYRPEMNNSGGRASVSIHMENNNLQTALEVVQTFGGSVAEEGEGTSGAVAGENPDTTIDIPAHWVTEDFTEAYASGENESYLEG